MRDKQHSFPLRIHSRSSMWRTTRLKMCWAGGWCFSRVLSYLCFSVEQGRVKSSEEGAASLFKYCLFIPRQRWEQFHIFPSLSVIIHQYFHVSLSPQIVWDKTVASPPAAGVSTSPLLRRPSSGPNRDLRRALYNIPYFTDGLNICRDRHIFMSRSTII